MKSVIKITLLHSIITLLRLKEAENTVVIVIQELLWT
jgi:hypothetical protein